MKLANLGALALSACLAGGCLAGCAPEPRIAVPDTGPAEEQPLAAATQEPAEEADVGEATPAAAEPESEPVHEHIWLPNYELQVIPAQTETIHHDAVTEEAVELHTVCNVCLAIVDGVADLAGDDAAGEHQRHLHDVRRDAPDRQEDRRPRDREPGGAGRRRLAARRPVARPSSTLEAASTGGRGGGPLFRWENE